METNPDNQRIDEFRAEIADLDIKTPTDSRERSLLIVAIVLMVIGVILIFGGYWGASGSSIVAEQIPYVISGGLLGLGLMVVGAALFVRYSLSRYLRYWLVRNIYEDRSQAERIAESLSGIEAVLRESTRDRAAQ